MIDVDARLEEALVALEAAGVDRSRVVLAIAGDSDGHGTPYAAHVGATEDKNRASMLEYMIRRDLLVTADQQVTALNGPESCPVCSSRRYGIVRRSPEFPRVDLFMVCMACGHEEQQP